MNKVILIYASMSGNTEAVAEAIAEGIREQGIELIVKEATEANPAQLLDYDGILIGSYTWGLGELADEMLDFYEDLDQVDLTGKKVAVFGTGDHGYPDFCAAVDIIKEKVEELGAELTQEVLKIENYPSEEDKDLCRAYGRRFVSQFSVVE